MKLTREQEPITEVNGTELYKLLKELIENDNNI